jgi:hypothetical protein
MERGSRVGYICIYFYWIRVYLFDYFCMMWIPLFIHVHYLRILYHTLFAAHVTLNSDVCLWYMTVLYFVSKRVVITTCAKAAKQPV